MQWLAIAPLLALSSTLTLSLVAGILTFAVLLVLSIVIAGVRLLIPSRMRMPVIILLLSTLTCLMEMGMKYYYYELYESTEIYLPLIAVNSLIYAIAGDYFFKNSMRHSIYQAVITGTVFMILFFLLGAFREAVGYGTLFQDIETLTAGTGPVTAIKLYEGFTGISLFHTPSGALMSCGLLAAVIRCVFKEQRSPAVTGVH